MRLDNYLVKSGFFESRNKASEAIKQRDVLVDKKIVSKPSFDVKDDSLVEVLDKKRYVSRAGYKLKEFLKDKDIKIEGKLCLDIGSSTGGFVEVLLEYGAKKVVAVDVGKEQLHNTLKSDSRVEVHEQTDIREFKSDESFDVVTCDVSFISLEYLLDDILRLSNETIILLFKPQYEVGKETKRDKRGVIKDKKMIQRALVRFESELIKRGVSIIQKEPCKIKGKEGNEEYFYYVKR